MHQLQHRISAIIYSSISDSLGAVASFTDAGSVPAFTAAASVPAFTAAASVTA